MESYYNWPEDHNLPGVSEVNARRHPRESPPPTVYVQPASAAKIDSDEDHQFDFTVQPTTSALRSPLMRKTTARSPLTRQMSPPSPQLDRTFDKERSTTFRYSNSLSTEQRPMPQTYLMRHKLALASSLPICYAVAELLMLVYFLDLFLSEPRKNGNLPRISDQYSLWPYISCMGSLDLVAFKIFSFVISFFFISAFSLDAYLMRNTQPGYWMRNIRAPLSILWGALNIWVAFESVHVSTHVHLYLVSVKLIAGILIKALTLLIEHSMNKHYPSLKIDRVAAISRRWKQIVMSIAFPLAVLASIGIYACMDVTEIQKPGTSCYVLVAVAAIADWAYAVITISFVLNIAYDIFHRDHLESARGMDAKSIVDQMQHMSLSAV